MTSSTKIDPTSRDPREFEHGLFLANTPAQGGATSFSWFTDDAEGLAYLAKQLPALYLEGEDLVDASKAIADACQGVTRLSTLDLAPINAALAGLCEVRWAGTFYDLESGNKPFEREIQENYRDNIFGDERAGDDMSTLDYLAEHLEHYAG